MLAIDFASKGDFDTIEVKKEDTVFYIHKKNISLKKDALKQPDEIHSVDDSTFSFHVDDELDEIQAESSVLDDLDITDYETEKQPNQISDLEMLQIKLKKTLLELEDIKSDMKNSFTSSDTVENTVRSIQGIVNALDKDKFAV